MTDQELTDVSMRQAKIVLAAMANNIRCFRCGWVGPEEKLYASGSIGRLTCPQCGGGYHWERANPGRWFTEADSKITCDPQTGCGDGSVYCSRRVVFLERQGLDYRGNPKTTARKSRPPSWWRRLFQWN